MPRKKLPIPLILLIPLCLLAVVIVAGIYRFSLSDEEILAKFPSQQNVQADPVVEAILGLKVPNPWTIQVPETSAFTLLTDIDADKQVAAGSYDDGMERGNVYLLYRYQQSIYDDKALSAVVIPFAVSNQGSGVFYYLGLFKWDSARQRVILSDAKFAGDRIEISALTRADDRMTLSFKKHGKAQSMSEAPEENDALVCVAKAFKWVDC